MRKYASTTLPLSFLSCCTCIESSKCPNPLVHCSYCEYSFIYSREGIPKGDAMIKLLLQLSLIKSTCVIEYERLYHTVSV